jgi:hypothetical protein
MAGAGAAAYATTRADTIGDYARSTGQAAVSTFESAKRYNAEHNITGKASECASAAANKAVEVNKQYHITERIGSAISLGTSKVGVCFGCGPCRLRSCADVRCENFTTKLTDSTNTSSDSSSGSSSTNHYLLC